MAAAIVGCRPTLALAQIVAHVQIVVHALIVVRNPTVVRNPSVAPSQIVGRALPVTRDPTVVRDRIVSHSPLGGALQLRQPPAREMPGRLASAVAGGGAQGVGVVLRRIGGPR